MGSKSAASITERANAQGVPVFSYDRLIEMDLLSLSSAVKLMVTGGVLLAVLVDAEARQQRRTSGRV